MACAAASSASAAAGAAAACAACDAASASSAACCAALAAASWAQLGDLALLRGQHVRHRLGALGLGLASLHQRAELDPAALDEFLDLGRRKQARLFDRAMDRFLDHLGDLVGLDHAHAALAFGAQLVERRGARSRRQRGLDVGGRFHARSRRARRATAASSTDRAPDLSRAALRPRRSGGCDGNVGVTGCSRGPRPPPTSSDRPTCRDADA
jgi:hypothetical protein